LKAWTYDQYGDPDVLRLVEDHPAPVPRWGEVLVDVHALALNPKDILVRKGKFDFIPGVSLPLVPGHDFAGVVVHAAPGADLAVGTRVYGWFESFTGGASAERIAIDAQHVGPIPESVSMTEAAAVPLAALTALQALRDELGVTEREHVVIHGASGGVGVFAVQIARILGARVTAVCSEANRELVMDLGADRHVDYRVMDPVDLRGVDAFFDVFGDKPWRIARQTLSTRGRYCTTLPRPRTAALGFLARLGLHRAHLVVVRSRRDDLAVLSRWMEQGALKPVIDRVLNWTELPEGHRRIETKRTRGKVVLTVR
jgi:NADPH:quinone reductase-like Zn-dependent oxidoreductase